MKKIEIERVIKVDVIVFDDGTEIDAGDIYKFLDEAFEYEDTVGKTGNWTSEYLYFETNREKKLEPILTKLNVIRKSPNHKVYNDKVGKFDSCRNYCYWLGNGYVKFRDKFYEATNV